MTAKHDDAEFTAFCKKARRFDNEPEDKRYGVLNPSANLPYTEKDMLYSDCVRKLHYLHFDNWPAVVLRKHLDNIEIADGKMAKGTSSIKQFQ